jgi:hypothetical protein
VSPIRAARYALQAARAELEDARPNSSDYVALAAKVRAARERLYWLLDVESYGGTLPIPPDRR